MMIFTLSNKKAVKTALKLTFFGVDKLLRLKFFSILENE